jgi:hypothetical protein
MKYWLITPLDKMLTTAYAPAWRVVVVTAVVATDTGP